MTLSRGGINLLLIVLFVGAVWVRMESMGDFVYPYYKGESGTNFRQTVHIAGRGSLPEIDKRAAWPEGISPLRDKANGIEYFAGFTYRLVKPFTDVSQKRFANILTILIFSLSVFILFALTKKLWSCQAAGLWAASMVAFSAPLIGATNGSEYFHDTFAFVIISFHLLMTLGAVDRPTLVRTLLSGFSAFLLFAVWEQAGLYVAVFCLVWTLFPGIGISARSRILIALLTAAVLAGLTLPHLRAQRFLFSWPAVLVFVAAAWMILRNKLPVKIPVWAAAGAFAVLTLIFRPIAAGGANLGPSLSYWFYRLRFIAGKPDDPSLLPESIRALWTHSHASPSILTVFAIFFPLVFLAVPAVVSLRSIRNEDKLPFWAALAAVAGAIVLFLIDRRAILAIALIVFPFVAVAFRGFSSRIKTRLLPAAIAAAILITSLPFTAGTVDTTGWTGRMLGIPPSGSGDFVWIGVGNADRDVIRFLVARTSTRRDVILAAPEASSLIPTFGGRATNIAPGIHTAAMSQKTVSALAAFYGDEDGLYAMCEALGATHVLYSIDMLLDSSKNSPRFAAGANEVSETTAAVRMHFAPETLRHFQLVYQNNNYRLFRVTAETQPAFITDHPPIYQKSILGAHGDTIDSFYNRVVDILLTYQTAIIAQNNGNEEAALGRLRYCLDQAPAYTDAWLRVGDSLLRLERPNDAFNAYNRVLQYAPDNKDALFYGALSLGYGDRRDEAVQLLDLLLTSTADRELRRKAQDLKQVLESGQPIVIPR